MIFEDASDLKRAIHQVQGSRYFDSSWYRHVYPDVEQVGMDPAEHYAKFGAIFRRNPGPAISTRLFLDSILDLELLAPDPLADFLHALKQKDVAQAPPEVP